MPDDPSKTRELIELLDELNQLAPPEQGARLRGLDISPEDRATIERCLRQQDETDSFLKSPPNLVTDAIQLLQHPGVTLPAGGGVPSPERSALCAAAVAPRVTGYEIQDMLGRGGMAIVWRATQTGTGQAVALKVLDPLLLSSLRARGRFEREVRLMGKLRHSNIARIYDGGVVGELCYYAMEVVDGRPLDEYVKQNHLSQAATLQLLLNVCRAVAYAHQNGVIHRDLKPSNILVDGEGQPRVLDFGLARALEEAAGDPNLTSEGELSGTPAFMSPEQAAGKSSLDTRTDVYSLGVIAYRLLTGQPPHDLGGSRSELLRRVIDSNVPRPRLVSSAIDRDLESILLKALSREPDGRYSSAGELTEDLRRYLAGEPISAKLPTFRYMFAKWVYRHKLPLSVAATVVGFMIGTVGYSYWKVVEHSRAEEKSANNARAEKNKAELSVADALMAQGDALASSQSWEQAKDRYQKSIEILKKHGEDPFVAELAMWSVNMSYRAPILDLVGHVGGVNHVEFLPGGEQFMTAGRDGTAKLWSTRTGVPIRSFEGLGDVARFSISPDGERVAFASMRDSVTLWSVSQGKQIQTIRGYTGLASAVRFSPDGSRLLVGTTSPPTNIYLYDSLSGKLIRSIGGHAAAIRDLVFTSDGNRAIACDGRPPGDLVSFAVPVTIQMWDLVTGEWVWRQDADRNKRMVGALAITPDGRSVVATSWDGFTTKRQVSDGKIERAWQSDRGRDVQGVAISASGEFLAYGGLEGSIRMEPLRSISSGWVPAWAFCGHPGETRSIAFSPDGSVLLSGGGDGTVRIWPIHAQSELQVLPTAKGERGQEVFSLSLSPDSRYALAGSFTDRVVRLWDLKRCAEVNRLRIANGHQQAAAFGPNGETIAVAEESGRVGIWDKLLGQRRRFIDPPDGRQFHGIALSRDGKTLMGFFESGSDIAVYDVTSGRSIKSLTLGGEKIRERRLCFSRDGTIAVASDSEAGIVNVWETVDWRLRFSRPVLRPTHVAVSPDASMIACTGADVRVLDAKSGNELHKFDEHADQLGGVAFLENQRFLLSEGAPGTGLALWDLKNRAKVRSFGPDQYIFDLAVATDGTIVCPKLIPGIGAVQALNMDWPRRYRALSEKLGPMRQRLEQNPSDGVALGFLGEWYAFRGMNGWAADFLERARAVGTPIDSELLAICKEKSAAAHKN